MKTNLTTSCSAWKRRMVEVIRFKNSSILSLQPVWILIRPFPSSLPWSNVTQAEDKELFMNSLPLKGSCNFDRSVSNYVNC